MQFDEVINVKYGNLVQLHKMFTEDKVDTGELVACESVYYLIREICVLVGGQGSPQTNKPLLTVGKMIPSGFQNSDTMQVSIVCRFFSLRATKPEALGKKNKKTLHHFQTPPLASIGRK